MSKFVQVGKIDELDDGAKKEAQADGIELLLARVGDQYYACQAHCPHWGWRLVRGTLEGTVLQCSFHYSRFDLKDGRVIRWTVGRNSPFDKFRYGFLSLVRKPKKLQIYKVKVENDDIMIEI